MKELTGKINMNNLGLIIKNLRSKSTSETFFNRLSLNLLLELAVAFYQFKDKCKEELILIKNDYVLKNSHDSFFDDLNKCISSKEIKESQNEYVKTFLESASAGFMENSSATDSKHTKGSAHPITAGSSLNSDIKNKSHSNIYEAYPYSKIKEDLCSFLINTASDYVSKDSEVITSEDKDAVNISRFFSSSASALGGSNVFFHEHRLVHVLCEYIARNSIKDRILFLSNALPYAEYCLEHDYSCTVDSYVSIDSRMGIDALVNFKTLKRFDDKSKECRAPDKYRTEKTRFASEYEDYLESHFICREENSMQNSNEEPYLHTPSLELNFIRALILKLKSPLTPFVLRKELTDHPHSGAFVCQNLFKDDVFSLCKYYYSLYNLLKRTVQKRFVIFVPHVITYTNANEGILLRRVMLNDGFLTSVIRLPRFFSADKDLLIDVLLFDKEYKTKSYSSNSDAQKDGCTDSCSKADQKLLLCNLSTSDCLDKKLSSKAHSVLSLKVTKEISKALQALSSDVLQKNSEHCCFVSVNTIKTNSDSLCKLDPTGYVSPSDASDSVAYIKKGSVRLDSVASIYKALTCKAPLDENSKQKLCELNLNDVPESGIITSVPKEVEVEEGLKQAERNLLKNSDVVISVKGAVGKVGFYKEGQKKVMAGQCFAIIRSKDPTVYTQEMLFTILRNDDMQDYIKTKITGDKLKVLQLSELKAIPLPDVTESMKSKAQIITQKLCDAQSKLEEIKNSIRTLGHERIDE